MAERNDDKSIVVHYRTSGNVRGLRVEQRLVFASAEDWVQWTSERKTLSKIINKIKGNPTRDQAVSFVVCCKRFKSKWGDSLVPMDLRDTMNEVERVNGLQITEWQE